MNKEVLNIRHHKRSFFVKFIAITSILVLATFFLKSYINSTDSSEYFKVEQLRMIEENIEESLEEKEEGTRDYALIDIEREYIVFVKVKFSEIMDELDVFRSLNVNKVNSKRWENKRNNSIDRLEEYLVEIKEFNSTPKQYKKQRDKLIESADEYLKGIEVYREAVSAESSELREQKEIKSAEHFAIGSVKLISTVDEIISENDI